MWKPKLSILLFVAYYFVNLGILKQMLEVDGTQAVNSWEANGSHHLLSATATY